jgi:hypothetical protein
MANEETPRGRQPTPAERITFESYINIDLLKNLGTGQ